MAIARRIAELERSLQAQQELVQAEIARLRCIEAELAALRDGATTSAPSGRSDAILQVLRDAGGTMSVSQIMERLSAAGRSDAANSVTATLSYLMKRDAVRRVGRGLYLAG